MCDPTILRAILAEASASGRSYQTRQVKGEDPDRYNLVILWSNRWQQDEGCAHRQIQPGVFRLRVTIVLGKTQ